MEKLQGKYYLRFKDQTWEQALAKANGFESCLEAVQEALDHKENTYTFIVSDYEGKILFDSANYEEEHLKCLGLVSQVNRYFVKADYDYSLSSAIADHTRGFASEQDAVKDMEESHEHSPDRVIYTVYFLNESLKFEEVYVGQSGNL